MRISNKINGLHIILFTFIVFSCEQESPDQHLKYLPKETAGVVSVQLGEILKKINYSSIIATDPIDNFLSEVRREFPRSVYQSLLSPDLLGLDLNSTAYFFFDEIDVNRKEISNFGFVIPLQNSDNFKIFYEETIDFFLKNAKSENLKLTKIIDDNYQYVKIKSYSYNMDEWQDLAVIGCNQEVMLLLVGNPDSRRGGPRWVEDFQSMIEGSQTDHNFIEKPGIANLKNFDLAVWLDSGVITGFWDELEDEIIAFDSRDVIDSYFTVGFSSEIDLIGLNIDYYHNDRVQSHYRPNLFKKIGSALVKQFPNDPMMGFGFAFNTDEIVKGIHDKMLSDPELKEQITQLETMTKITKEELASFISGNVLAAIYDFDLRREQAEFVIGAGVNSGKLVELANTMTGQEFIKINEPVALSPNISLLVTNDFAFLSSPNFIRSIQKGNDKSTFDSGLPQKLSNSSFYLFADPEKTIKAMPTSQFGYYEKAIMSAILDLDLGIIDIGQNYSKTKTSIFINARTKNTQKNPITSLSETLIKFDF